MSNSSKSSWLLVSTSLVSVLSLTGQVSAQEAMSGSVSLSGGAYEDVEYKYLSGTLIMPTDGALSLQFDGVVGRLDGEVTSGLGIQAIWETSADSSFGLLADAFRSDAAGDLEQQHLGLTGGYYADTVAMFGVIGQQYGLNEGTFGSVTATYLPTDDLSIWLGYEFQPDSDGMTRVGIDKRFLVGGSSMSLFADAGYVHETESWSSNFGMRIYFGDTRRAEVSRGPGTPRERTFGRGFNPGRLFFRAAARQTQYFNDSLVE